MCCSIALLPKNSIAQKIMFDTLGVKKTNATSKRQRGAFCCCKMSVFLSISLSVGCFLHVSLFCWCRTFSEGIKLVLVFGSPPLLYEFKKKYVKVKNNGETVSNR